MSKSELHEVLEDIDVEDFLCHLGVDFKITHGSSGTQANIRECPRCGGTRSKVYIGLDSGLGNCFHGSCQGEPGYNLFTFTRAFLGSGREAYSEIMSYKNRNGWIPTKKRESHSPAPRQTVTLPKSYPIPINGKNLKYLVNRNIDIYVAKLLGLRFCKSGRFEYQLAGKDKYQVYDNRLIIPVLDEHGELVTFQGRDITNRAEQKYLFPPGLSGTGRYLYNSHNAIGRKSIIISEGALDVAAILMAFIGTEFQDIGVVGSFGKHLSSNNTGQSQLSQLLRMKQHGLNEITFMWDGEKLALDEACKSALMLRSYGFQTRVAVLPKDKDPNEVTAEVIIRAYLNAELASPLSMAKLRLRLIE